jgi:hypothetical protein
MFYNIETRTSADCSNLKDVFPICEYPYFSITDAFPPAKGLDKLHSTEQNLGRVFNFRIGCLYGLTTVQPNLVDKVLANFVVTQPRNVLCALAQ